jgi:glycosyltransferase involved in cell wall biosynthesis
MKILMVCEFFDEALDYQENFLAKVYHRLGHEVLVVTSTTASVFDYTVDADGETADHGETRTDYARILRKPWRLNILHRIKAFESLTPLIERERPDLIYFHDVMPNMLDALGYMRRNPDARMIMDCHADLSNSGANLPSRLILHGVVRKAILDRARPVLSKIFPVVPAATEFLKTYYRLRDDEMELLPLGVDLDVARQARARAGGRNVRHRLGIPEDAFVVFTGGKLAPAKRTEEAIAALARLQNPDVHLIVIGKLGGPGSDEDYAALLEAAAGRVRNVHFVGWQDRDGVYDHMDAADLAVFPASQSVLWQQSLGMGLPLAVAEFAAGMRARQDVSYMAGLGAVTVLDHRADVPLQIAELVRALRADPALHRERRQAALDTAESILNYERIAAQTLRFNAAG